MTYVRGANPIWSLVDLTGKQFDDTYYMFVLENVLPYLPANVYRTPSGTEWTQSIQFLANGTLPIDIYWDPDEVYRLEFRQGDTQSDPLIYEVNNYSPGSGGDTPIDSTAVSSDNQITNPQFSILSFNSPMTLTGVTLTSNDPIPLAPGWDLVLSGTGNVTLTQVALTSTQANPTNPPYALHIELSGWTDDPYLRQRFEQNGVLWSTFTEPRYVSNSVTAKVGGTSETIIGKLYDSLDTELSTVLPTQVVSQTYNEFVDHGLMPVATNTDTPPDAYVEYRLFIAKDADIYITSVQLVTSNSDDDFNYIQDTIERQQDHTFNYYKDPLLFKPIPSMLTGWDFPLNPAQFGSSPSPTITTTAEYIWDQTIAACEASTVATARNSVTGGIQATTSGANRAFYYMQYLSGNKVREMILNKLSVNVSGFRTQAGGDVTVRVYLYRAPTASTIPLLPLALGTVATSGVFTLTAPVIADNWTLIPRGTFPQTQGNLSTVNTADYTTLNDIVDLQFTGWEETSSARIADTDKFAIVVTFQCPETGTVVTINSISLVPGDVATRPAPQTIDEVLRECQYYFEKSYIDPYPLAATSLTSQLVFPIATSDLSGTPPGQTTSISLANGFSIRFNTAKKSLTPIVSIYTPTAPVSAGTFYAQINGTSALTGTSASVKTLATYWDQAGLGQKGVSYVSKSTLTSILTVTQASTLQATSSYIRLHFDADSRLGKV